MKKKKIITKINEFVDNKDYGSNIIVEMATISDPKKDPFFVIVNGFGNRSEHGEPHFHLTDKIDSEDYNLSIKIPTINEWKKSQELEIISTHSTQKDWNGLRKVKDDLVEWMSKKHKKVKEHSNLFMVILFWNELNDNNKNVSQVQNNGEDLRIIL